MTHHLRSYAVLTALITLAAALTLKVYAQDAALPVTRTAEYDIGVSCPVSVTLDPTQTVIWVLMNSCGQRNFELRGFNTADGSPVEADAHHFAEALAPLDDQVVYAPTLPLAFTPDGIVDVIYNDPDSYDAHKLRLSLTAEPLTDSPIMLLSRDTLEQFIPAYAGYLETTVYNTTHTVAIVADTATFHIIDLQAGTELFQLEAQPETYGSYPSFSADGKTLYITTLNHPDDINDYSSVLKVYSLPDGALQASYDVPSFILWVSPDGRYAAAQLNDTELAVVELATGRLSPRMPINEKPRLVTKCLNNGRAVDSGIGYMTRGDLFLIDAAWLPDSSGFLTVNSYLGDGARNCIFDYSRLRHYRLNAGG